LREAPPILELEEHEKFKDDEGNVYEVEVRGVREKDKIFFKASDIEELFKIENLVYNIKREGRYINKEDYETFLVRQEDHRAKRVKKTFITYSGLRKVLCTSRSIDPKFLKMFSNNTVLKELGMNLDVRYLYKEQETISKIVDSFKEEETIKQFSVLGYRIDLYFPEYRLAVECDEYGHSDRDAIYESTRQREITKELDCTFIRYNPDKPNFNIFEVESTILTHIDQLKRSNTREDNSLTNTLKQHKKKKNLRQKERRRFARRFEKLSEEEKAIVTTLFEGLSLLETSPPTTDDSE
jgi:very-short-patch-repair endonuclease